MTLDNVKAVLDGLPEETDPLLVKARAEVETVELEGALRDAALRAGVDGRAVPDVVARGLKVFKLEKGQPVPSTPRYSRARPQDVLGVDEWAAELRHEAPHLFRGK
jgi:hypothetical protein